MEDKFRQNSILKNEIQIDKKIWQSPEIHDWLVENDLKFKGGFGVDGGALPTYAT